MYQKPQSPSRHPPWTDRTQHTNPWGNGDYSIKRVAWFHISGSSRFVKARSEPRAQCDGKRWRMLFLASVNRAATVNFEADQNGRRIGTVAATEDRRRV